MSENDLIKRIEELEKDNARLRKIEKELKNTVKGFNKLIATNNIMLKEIKSQKVELVKDSISFKHLFQTYNEKDWHILRHMEAFWGDVPNWNKITDDSLADFQNFLRSQKKRIGEGLLSETTIALYMNLIKGTIKRGYSPRTNGGQNVKVLKAAKKKKECAHWAARVVFAIAPASVRPSAVAQYGYSVRTAQFPAPVTPNLRQQKGWRETARSCLLPRARRCLGHCRSNWRCCSCC